MSTVFANKIYLNQIIFIGKSWASPRWDVKIFTLHVKDVHDTRQQKKRIFDLCVILSYKFDNIKGIFDV